MNKNLLMGAFVLLTTPFAWSQDISLSREVFNGRNQPFRGHQGSGRFDTYLTMQIPFAPVQKVYKEIMSRSRLAMTTRGEAHITVIGPLEFSDQLQSYISMDEIDDLAKKLKIQETKFKILCLGSAEKMKNGKFTKTYYFVVESEQLFDIRRKILKKITSAGGSPTLFNPENYYPHITVGFINDDLHESDGVFKDSSTCETDIVLE